MCPYSMCIYHMHPRQYMSHACTVIKQCLPVIVYETGTCLRRHLSAHLRCEHILVPCFKEKLTNLWNRCLADIVCYGLEGYCYVSVGKGGDLQRDGDVSSSTAEAHWVCSFTPHPGPQAFCLPLHWSFSSSHSSTPWGEKPGKVAAEIRTSNSVTDEEMFNIIITVVSVTFWIILGR